MSNKYRRIQTKILELDDAAKNELSEGLYNMIRERLITPMSDYLFHLHLAYENGRNADNHVRKGMAKVKKLLDSGYFKKKIEEKLNAKRKPN